MKLNPTLANLKGALTQLPIRNGYGDGLVLAGDKDKNVIVLCADLTESTRSLAFKTKYPDRFIEVGVAEQNMASLASGLAAVGKVPFISSYAMFSPGRNWEQIRTTVCYNGTNVKIGGAHAGISVGPDGATHQAIEDVAILRPIANMTIIVPCDAIEARKATLAAAAFPGPVYLRFAREKTPVVTTDATSFTIGKIEPFVEGTDVVLVAMGVMVYEAIVAAQQLEKDGISAAVLNCHTVKPLDSSTLLTWARRCGAVVTCEEHQVIGGLGSAVAELLSSEYPVPIKKIGVQNKFGQSGSSEELMKVYGLKAVNIVEAAKEAVKLKFSHAANMDHVPRTPRGPEAKRVAARGLKTVSNDIAFYARNGTVVHSLPELHKVVRSMDHDTFNHHVSGARHDFAQWVADVHQDNELAAAMRKAVTKTALSSVIGHRIGQLLKVQG